MLRVKRLNQYSSDSIKPRVRVGASTPGSSVGESFTVFEPISDVLDAACWCGYSIVKVPQREIRNGRTYTCGARECRP